jgi:integrase
MPLSDTACRNAKPGARPQKRSDGGGLFLLIAPTGGKLWRFSYRFGGKQKTLAFGAYPVVSLAEARRLRDFAREQLAKGTDPAVTKKEAKRAAKIAEANSFEQIAREWHENQREGWTGRTADYVIRRLETDIFPELGSRPIAQIEAPELLDVMRSIERRGAPEIARRALAVCGQVFRYAIVTGRGRRDPAADLRGALKARPRQQHHQAMARDDLPAFLQSLSDYDGDPRTALALRLVVLTMVRTTELRAARWSEFEDLDGNAPLWRIPSERMKMRAEHLVPLAPRAVTILKDLKRLSGDSAFVFPSRGAEQFMSNNTMLYALYRLGYHRRATVHGFRGLASTLLNEMGFNSDWIEKQLAHEERNKVRGAYNAAQYLEGRRRMMLHWARFLEEVEESGTIVVPHLREAA